MCALAQVARVVLEFPALAITFISALEAAAQIVTGTVGEYFDTLAPLFAGLGG